jgi:hypothetical protein
MLLIVSSDGAVMEPAEKRTKLSVSILLLDLRGSVDSGELAIDKELSQ